MSDSSEEVDERTGLAKLTTDQSIELMTSIPIGRVVFIDDDQYPIASPVNYRWVDDSIVFRTLEGQKLHAIALQRPVSFEVDRWDDTTHTGASVIVKGQAVHVTNWAEKEQLEQLGLTPWAPHPWRQIWVRIIPEEITGRQLTSQ